MRLQHFLFRRLDDWGINLQERDRRIVYAIRITLNRFFLRSGWFGMPCQAMGAVRVARGDRMLGANVCRGASWSVRNSADWSREDAPFSGHSLPIVLHCLQVWYADSKGGIEGQTRFRKFVSSNLRWELALVASVALSERASKNSCS